MKALERSDEVILDLEDAVAPFARQEARRAIRALAADGVLDVGRTVLRVNGPTTRDHGRDVELANDLGIQRVMVAKAERPDDVVAVPTNVVVLCESPRGIEAAADLAVLDNVVAVMWGADDFIAGLGGTSSRHDDGSYRDVVRWARSRCLVAAKSYGRLAVDNVFVDIAAPSGLTVECEDAVAVGFDAKAAIHPSQVPVIRAAFMPSAAHVDWARRLLTEAARTPGVFIFEGRMVDGPIFDQARRTLFHVGIEDPT